MKVTHVWRNCYIREIEIPEVWKNSDCLLVEPRIQDLFYVFASKDEIKEHLLEKMSLSHKNKISDISLTCNTYTVPFMISRDTKYIQYYPYFVMNTPGSLWEKISESIFFDLPSLSNIDYE